MAKNRLDVPIKRSSLRSKGQGCIYRQASRRNKQGQEARQRLFEFDKLELQMAIDTYKSLYILWVAFATGLTAANVTLIVLAFNSRNAVACIVGCFFPCAIYLMGKLFERAMLPLAYSAISIEQRYSRDEDLVDAVVSTFLFTQMGNKEIKDELGRKKMVGAYGYVRSLIHLAQNERSHEERMHALRTFPTPYLNFPYGKLLLGVAVIIQVALAVGFTAYPLP